MGRRKSGGLSAELGRRRAREGIKVLSNTIETNFQILSTKYAKFQPNIQIFEYSISCLVSYINHYFVTNKSK